MQSINKKLFYVLSWTWGFIMSFIGLLVVSTILLFGLVTKKNYKLKKHGWCYYLTVGKSWGGLEFGMFFLTDNKESLHTKDHEFGHSIQNCVWGPLFLFVVCIPSATRYWLRKFKSQAGKNSYATLLALFAFFVGLAIMSIGFIVSPVLILLAALWVIYWDIIYMWLMYSEIPQYADDYVVPYDSIWFEEEASELGRLYRINIEEGK